jgi:hypothetical protein
MTNKNRKRSLLDDLVDGAREIMEALDRLLNPGRRPKHAPVPVPVRPNPRPDQRRR